MLGALLRVLEEVLAEADVLLRVAPRGRDPAIGCVIARPACTFTRASGEAPTIQNGSSWTSRSARKYMTGSG